MAIVVSFPCAGNGVIDWAFVGGGAEESAIASGLCSLGLKGVLTEIPEPLRSTCKDMVIQPIAREDPDALGKADMLEGLEKSKVDQKEKTGKLNEDRER